MTELYATLIFLFALFALLGGSVWVGLALVGVAFIGMELFTSRPAGDAMITTIWTGASSWTLTALPFQNHFSLVQLTLRKELFALQIDLFHIHL